MKGRKGRGAGHTIRRRRSDRGAVLIETAITLPFLFLLLFGIIDFGFVFNDWISVRQGGRDGLRQAIVNTKPAAPGGGGWSCPISGSPPAAGSDAQSMVCYTKLRVGLDQSSTHVKIFFNAPYKAGQPVKLCVQYATSSVTGAYSSALNNKVLDTQVESLIEQDEPTFTAPFEEASPAGWPASCNTL